MSTETLEKPVYVNLQPGDPAPWFHQQSTTNPSYAFDTAAGRYIVLCFFASAGDGVSRAALDYVAANRKIFDDVRFCFFGVSNDPQDKAESRFAESLPGLRYFFDFDRRVATLYGALPKKATPGADAVARRFWVVLDPTLRVIKVIPFTPDGSHAGLLFAYLERLPPPERFAGVELQAPILFLPNVFEDELCRKLIAAYEQQGGEESGFMRDVDGKTVGMTDASYKRRKDHTLSDQGLIATVQGRVKRRIHPEILRIYSFNATRMERYIVSCYAAEDGGHFRPHRDNTTKGTAHRRFAVSINLNGDFNGGEVSFPEYGPRSFKAPPGGAVIFPCNLMHAVSKVSKGRRFAFLPFLYDDEAAKIRETNIKFMPGAAYKA
ncbi:MAG: 2OG-Fe(II) oxygenase [Pseudorhodoplanes sp.]